MKQVYNVKKYVYKLGYAKLITRDISSYELSKMDMDGSYLHLIKFYGK